MVLHLLRCGRPRFTQGNWEAELYGLLPTLTHTWLQEVAWVPWLTASTCRLNCVKLIEIFSRPDRWKGTPHPKPTITSDPRPVASLGVGCSTEEFVGTFDRRGDVTPTSPEQKKLANHCIILFLYVTMYNNYNRNWWGGEDSSVKCANWLNEWMHAKIYWTIAANLTAQLNQKYIDPMKSIKTGYNERATIATSLFTPTTFIRRKIVPRRSKDVSGRME